MSPSLASEEPKPKRTEADSSLITQLFNEKFIKDLACVMALDEHVVGMAEKLLECAKSEHGTLNLDAWEYFTSVLKWQNSKLLMQQYPTKMGPKQQHLSQQIQETKARMSDESLKPLFAEKEHDRVVLVLVILFWSRDVCGLEERTDICAGFSFEDDELDMGCCAYNKSFEIDSYLMGLPSENEEKMMENLAKQLIDHTRIVEKFRDLVETVPRETPDGVGALKHLKTVKEVWRNHTFINHLLKFEDGPMPGIGSKSSVRLSFKIWSRIKEDPLFEVISVYKDPDFRMRVASSILIGFWSNLDMIRPLVCQMGGNALGVKKKQSGEEKDESPRDWMLNSPNIMEFYRDKSIWKLAVELKEEPIAVLLAKMYLRKLKLEVCQCSFLHHFDAATDFWHHPSIVLKFNEAMEKDPKLVDVLTKYSKGAETLRVQERLVHVRKELELELQETDLNDSLSMLRLALKILFGYWVDRDLTQRFQSFSDVKKTIGKDFDLCKEKGNGKDGDDDDYCSPNQGLNSWLARKYGKRV